ncbi:helix-turn-helix domain-containing protein [Kribbella sp. NPDC051620]|uniref:helix-turn-helix domain-containing protein n=1 Tax=Kribbella sp. NPDC051620 TaxID=3364120 RepID=UPI00378B976F
MRSDGGDLPAGVMNRPPSTYLQQFADLLDQVRIDADLTVRELGELIEASSHSQPVRVTGGDRLPRWQSVSNYLIGCGAGGGILQAWLELWRTLHQAVGEIRRPSHPDPGAFWAQIEQDWQRGLTAIRRPDPLLIELRKVSTLKELGIVIQALAVRAGLSSVREVANRTGIPKTTVNHWYKGTRKPSLSRLSILAVLLGATDAEEKEFSLALGRIRITCEAWSPRSGQRCMLSETHRGRHQSIGGDRWLDDGELDGTQGPRTAANVGVRGPFW